MKKTLFLGALLVAATAASGEPSPATTDNSSANASSANQVICRNQQDTTSLVGHVRVCLTREQWAQQQRRNGPPGRSPRPDIRQQ